MGVRLPSNPRKDAVVNPDTSVEQMPIDDAVQSALQHAIDAMFVDRGVPERFDDFGMRSLVFAPAMRWTDDDEDQSSSDGGDEA